MTRRAAPAAPFVLFLALAAGFFFPANLAAEERVVTIESARTSEYIRTPAEPPPEGVDAPDGAPPGEATESIRFSGDVMIVVTDGSSVSRIGADEIVYDKSRDTLEARGNVLYEHTTGRTSSEKFEGEALLFDIEKQEGVFLEGALIQDSGTKKADPYIIRAEVTGRDSGTTIAFRNGILTTCDAEDPHWSINATRIWLLPGNEIAILNGIFFIGPLPVFYIPVFYYPSDEMIVHPVFGFRNREGYFVQTTSYLMGRKPLPLKSGTGTGTSFSDFLQGDTLKEQERNGLFLRNLEADAKNTDPDYLKLLADGYSSLGALVGIDGSFTPDSYVKSVAFTADLGMSRSLYAPVDGLFYSTYDANGEQRQNSGWLYGKELPVRYRSNFSLQMDRAPFQLSVSMPLVSDPWFKSDFLDRSEDLNWFKFLTDQDSLAKGKTVSEETSYSWNINGSIRPELGFGSPWITNFSVSAVSALLTFNSKENATITTATYDTWDPTSPERKFFYPEMLKPEMRLSLGGTLFSSDRPPEAVRPEKSDTGMLSDPFLPVPGESSAPAAMADAGFLPPAGSGLIPLFDPPVSAWAITWTADPSIVQETRYDSTDWDVPADINWNTYSSLYYQLKNSVVLAGRFTRDVNFFTAASSLNYTGITQDHPWLSEKVETYDTAFERDTIRFNDYTASVWKLTAIEALQLVPFNRQALLKPVSLAWNFTGDIARSSFDGTAGDPDWKTDTFEWDKKYISVHTATTAAGVSLADYEQKITLTSNLAPLLESYAGTAGFAWPFGALGMNSRLYEKENDYKKWFWDPYKALLSWKLPWGITLGQEYVYDIEEETPTRLNFTGGKGYFAAFYTLTSTIPYELVDGSGWIPAGTEKDFLPTAAGFTFNNSTKPVKLLVWKNRVFLQANLVSNLQFNLLKLTDSSFDFVPTLTFKIHEFLDLSFSSNSRNDVIARYFQDWVDLPAPLPGETGILADLFKSFDFFNLEDRTSSGFKLKSLDINLTHYLHDWTMNLTASVKPELNTQSAIYRYDFKPTVIFMVQWKPISDIKTTVKSEKGVFTLNTSTPK